MKDKMNSLQKIGLILILLSAAALLGSELLSLRNRTAAEALADQLVSRLPAVTQGDPGTYSDTAMPVLQLEGTDFSGLIQVPAFGVSLPMANDWSSSSISRHPCRFWGSVYNHSLIVGGSTHNGQFDFFGKLDLGDRVMITDLAGARFSYEVIRIDRRSHADLQTLQEFPCDLVLFARDTSTLDYLIVRCDFGA